MKVTRPRSYLKIQMMKEIKLTQGKIALVDDEDYEYLMQWKWHARKDSSTYYAQRAGRIIDGNRRAILIHRVIMNCPQTMEVDHIDHNGLNNQKSNLRICTHHENSMNQRKPKNNTTGHIGVTFRRNKYEAYIKINGNKKEIGTFKCIDDAILAYNNAAIKYFGIFSNTLNND